MSFLTAAVAVLQESARPMTASELARAAIERGLIVSKGRTPDATIAAQLYTHVRDHPESALRRVAVPGSRRAKRGSVRWLWAEGRSR